MELVKDGKRYTYADYAAWDTDVRYELIDGAAYAMDGPTYDHQKICGELHRQIANFLMGKTCEVIAAPFDVRLNVDDEDNNVFQPDLIVVCDRVKLENGKNCAGSPDMEVEILSPSTARKDKMVKFNRYLKAGVREYWIVDPDAKVVQVFLLDKDNYIVRAYEDTETAPVNVLEGCIIDLSLVFQKFKP